MYAKHIKGIVKATLVLILNNDAVNGGIIAPPTIDIIIKEEANFEPSPKFLQDNAKMVGNMIDWQKYTNIKATTALIPPPNMATINETTAPIA
jgi:hypothetical protein